MPWLLTHSHVTHVPQSPAPFLVTQQVHPRSTARSPRTRMSLAHGGYHFDRAVAHAIWEWPVMGWQLKPCLLISPEVPQGQQLQHILHTLHVIKNTALPSFWIFGPGQKALKLVYFQNLFLTHTTFPAVTSVSLFHRSFAPLKQNHNHFNSQGLVPLKPLPRPPRRSALRGPYSCTPVLGMCEIDCHLPQKPPVFFTLRHADGLCINT